MSGCCGEYCVDSPEGHVALRDALKRMEIALGDIDTDGLRIGLYQGEARSGILALFARARNYDQNDDDLLKEIKEKLGVDYAFGPLPCREWGIRNAIEDLKAQSPAEQKAA